MDFEVPGFVEASGKTTEDPAAAPFHHLPVAKILCWH
jgi:hypothetical protein